MKSVSQLDTTTVICKQLLISNDRNRVRWVVLSLSEDGACTDLSENLSVNSLKGDLSNATTSNPPFFSLVNTFKQRQIFGPIKLNPLGATLQYAKLMKNLEARRKVIIGCSLVQNKTKYLFYKKHFRKVTFPNVKYLIN